MDEDLESTVLAGKAEPNDEDLSMVQEAGFDFYEVRLRPFHLIEPLYTEGIEKLEEWSNNEGLEPVTIHSPHVMPYSMPHTGRDDFPEEEVLDEDIEDLNFDDYIERGARIAEQTGSSYVIHSMGVHEDWISDIMNDINCDVETAVEHHNAKGYSAIQNGIIDPGYRIVYDTAHHFNDTTKDSEFKKEAEELFRNHSDQIEAVHFNDARRRGIQDGLPLGDGEMPVQETYDIIRSHYDGPVVIEVMPEYQEQGRETIQNMRKQGAPVT